MVNHKKLKEITLTLDGVDYQCQVSNWQVVNNTEDGERFYTFCPDGEFREEADPDYALELTYFADWTVGGISDVLTTLDGQWVTFLLVNHPDDPDWGVQWTGECKVKAPSAGGAVRTTETQTVTFPIEGKPIYSRDLQS
ncbi:hypothetical protein [Jiangella asiatica]|uniref:Phage tail protein n=1 Tax=Jiangella asiatica TaxID=2530372 RepID=A0A4R5CFJ9_9ACTN|nr:hypothetical protein [Jiangella asiatica]TDD98898.1 hypothetical protein E1269_28245 [Jiangella asiatica]